MKRSEVEARSPIHREHRGRWFVAIVSPVLALGTLAGVLRADVEIETIAFTGMQVPGAAEGVVFGPRAVNGERFTAPKIDGKGQVIFTARMTGPGIDAANSDALFLGDSFENLSIVARTGDQAPGMPAGTNFVRASDLGFVQQSDHYQINDAGQYLFRANVGGSGVTTANDRGLWTGTTAADMTLVFRANDPAPGFPGLVIEPPSHLRINGAGQFAFWAHVNGSGVNEKNNLVIWTGHSAEDLMPFLREGQTSPGDLELDFISNTPEGGMNFVLNGNGQFLVVAVLTESGYEPRSQPALSTYLTGRSYEDLMVVAVQEEPAPALPEFTIGIGCPSCSHGFNNDGRIATSYKIKGPGLKRFENDTAIWTGTDRANQRLNIRTGEQAPDTEPGTTFSRSPRLIVGAGSDLLLLSALSGPGVDNSNDNGIWMGTSGDDLRLVARKGDVVAGTNRTVNGARPIMNSVGQVAFGGGRWGLFFFDPSHGVQYICGPGDTLEVAPGDFRTVTEQWIWEWYAGELSGPEDGVSSSFNDRGQLAFRAMFEDGTEGIFVATIPKPTAVVLQVADSLTGPWTVIDEATSPYTVAIKESKFFRASGRETSIAIKRNGMNAEISWSPK